MQYNFRTYIMDPTHPSAASGNDPFDLDLPSPASPLRESATPAISWQEFMDETAMRTRLYLERYDDREERARSRNSNEFVWL